MEAVEDGTCEPWLRDLACEILGEVVSGGASCIARIANLEVWILQSTKLQPSLSAAQRTRAELAVLRESVDERLLEPFMGLVLGKVESRDSFTMARPPQVPHLQL